jgi:hypothetical protein
VEHSVDEAVALIESLVKEALEYQFARAVL